MVGKTRDRYIVICQSAWCNASGFGIDYGWDGEEFDTRAAAKKHGFSLRESDDFNIGVIRGSRLVSFDWMDKPTGEDDASMAEIARALGLRFTPAGRTTPPPTSN